MKYKINPSIKINNEEDNGEIKYIFYNIDEDRIFVLNFSAFEIYKFLEAGLTKEDILAKMIEKYTLEKNEEKLIEESIQDMVDKGIVLPIHE